MRQWGPQKKKKRYKNQILGRGPEGIIPIFCFHSKVNTDISKDTGLTCSSRVKNITAANTSYSYKCKPESGTCISALFSIQNWPTSYPQLSSNIDQPAGPYTLYKFEPLICMKRSEWEMLVGILPILAAAWLAPSWSCVSHRGQTNVLI
jgi:hypothetical protein